MAQNVTIVTDSCASLPDGTYEQYGIVMVPYYVHVGQTPIRDLVDMTPPQFHELLRTVQEIPKSANPAPGDYLEAFKKAAQHSDTVISVNMTSKGSGGYQTAMIAKEMAAKELPGIRIEVVDTLNVSMCQGWMALQAARAAQQGATADEVLAIIQRMMPATVMLQTADTLKYLYMGGRIGKAQHMVGTLLNVKPIISMDTEGVIVPLGQARGKKAVFGKFGDLIAAKVGERGRIHAAVVRSGDDEGAAMLQEMLQERFQCDELVTCYLSLALCVHTGPTTTGVCYFPSAVLQA